MMMVLFFFFFVRPVQRRDPARNRAAAVHRTALRQLGRAAPGPARRDHAHDHADQHRRACRHPRSDRAGAARPPRPVSRRCRGSDDGRRADHERRGRGQPRSSSGSTPCARARGRDRAGRAHPERQPEVPRPGLRRGRRAARARSRSSSARSIGRSAPRSTCGRSSPGARTPSASSRARAAGAR